MEWALVWDAAWGEVSVGAVATAWDSALDVVEASGCAAAWAEAGGRHHTAGAASPITRRTAGGTGKPVPDDYLAIKNGGKGGM